MMSAQHAMYAVLVVMIGVIALSLARVHKSDSRANLMQLITKADGTLDRGAVVMFGGFALLAWVILVLTVQGKMTEGYFTAFGGLFVAPILVRNIFGDKPDAAQPPSQ